MKTFVAVATAGSFSKAAGQLQISPQLVSKYVAALEADLSVRLINRSTRRLSITEEGKAYLERCADILADIDELEDAVGSMTATAHGLLRVNAPMSFGIAHLAKAVAGFQGENPNVSISMTLDDRRVDVISEGFDLALRIGALEDSNLIARKLCTIKRVVCASEAYLERHGCPQTPDDLLTHQCLTYSYGRDQNHWKFSQAKQAWDVKVAGPITTNNGEALQVAAEQGAGIIFLPSFIVADSIEAGRLVPILKDYAAEDLGLYALYAHRKFLSAKVRSFVDYMALQFADPPYWDQAIAGSLR